jgi:glycosyltransferase involved in cell wall biosynthesis
MYAATMNEGDMMSTKPPKISIGLPVRNGEEYLEESIDSILVQTYTDFELIISDNASTDRTEAICRAYAAKDERVRYHRNPVNIGGANNGNLTFQLARGEYFRWAAHDDVCEPELLASCIAVLEREPEIVLCASQILPIDEQGNETYDFGMGHAKGNAGHGDERTVTRELAVSPQPHARFYDIALRPHACEAVYGLIRADILRKTRLEQNYTDSDRILLSELALRGRFFEVPVSLFRKRWHSKNVHVDMRARMAWFNPDAKGKITFVHWNRFFGYLTTINRVPMSWYVRLRCYLIMVVWLFDNARYMMKDLLVALMTVTHIYKSKLPDRLRYNWE